MAKDPDRVEGGRVGGAITSSRHSKEYYSELGRKGKIKSMENRARKTKGIDVHMVLPIEVYNKLDAEAYNRGLKIQVVIREYLARGMRR